MKGGVSAAVTRKRRALSGHSSTHFVVVVVNLLCVFVCVFMWCLKSSDKIEALEKKKKEEADWEAKKQNFGLTEEEEEIRVCIHAFSAQLSLSSSMDEIKSSWCSSVTTFCNSIKANLNLWMGHFLERNYKT